MTRFLLDTGIAGDYINRRKGVFERAKEEAARGNRIGICIPVLGELYGGVEASRSREKNLTKLLHALSVWTIWPYTEKAAARFGQISAHLKSIGRPIQQIDMQIAAIALTLGDCTVVSSDTDFKVVPGLRLENWASPKVAGKKKKK
jgi:tRNA(fMet)-specific endonuclease VapC